MKSPEMGNAAIQKTYWFFVLLFVGMVMIVFQSVGFDCAYLPGDFGDGRFNSYLLEHGYRYLIGIEPEYWNAPFMYPEKFVIAYSDNHFGSLPFYISARLFFDRETSYQIWYLILIALNYIFCFYAFRKLKLSVYASSIGAFIYAFSTLLILQNAHTQLLPRFIAPLAIVYFYLWLQNKNNKDLYWTILLTVYQFYCAIYLGYFLFYVLIVLALAYVIIERKFFFLRGLFENKKAIVQTSLVLFIAGLLMVILLYPYYIQSLDAQAYPSKEVLLSMIPRLWSFFYTSENSVLWGGISTWIRTIIPENIPAHEHQIYIGITPYVVAAAAFFMFRKVYIIKFFLIAALIFMVATISVNNYSIYGIVVDYIPGARAIRAFARYMVIIVFLWSMVVALFIDHFFNSKSKGKMILMFLIPLFLFIDNVNNAKSNVHSKQECVDRYSVVVDLYNKKKKFIQDQKAFAYTLKFKGDIMLDPEYLAFKEKHSDIPDSLLIIHFRTGDNLEGHIDAMMASQIINMPCVNAYTGRFPDEYHPFFFNPSAKTLMMWLNSERSIRESGKHLSEDSILILE